MVDTVKISELPAVVAADGTSVFPVVQGGVTKKESINQVGGQIQLNDFTVSLDTGTANAYIATLTPIPVDTKGLIVYLFVENTNTGASTLNTNGTGIVNITNTDGTPIVSGEMYAGGISILMYDGTNAQLLNPRSIPFGLPQGVANIRYVDSVNGSDSLGNGTQDLPWKTIAHAQSQIVSLTPSSTNIFTLFCSGNFNENVQIYPYVNLTSASKQGCSITCPGGFLTQNNAAWLAAATSSVSIVSNLHLVSTGINVTYTGSTHSPIINFYNNLVDAASSLVGTAGDEEFNLSANSFISTFLFDSVTMGFSYNNSYGDDVTIQNTYSEAAVFEVASLFNGNLIINDVGTPSTPFAAQYAGGYIGGQIQIVGTQGVIDIDPSCWPNGGFLFSGGATLAANVLLQSPIASVTNNLAAKQVYVATNGNDTLSPTVTGQEFYPVLTINGANALISGQTAASPWEIDLSAGALSGTSQTFLPNVHINGKGIFASIYTFTSGFSPSSTWASSSNAYSSFNNFKCVGNLNCDFSSIASVTGAILNLTNFEVTGTSTFTADSSGHSITYNLNDCILVGNVTVNSCELTLDTGTEFSNVTCTTTSGNLELNIQGAEQISGTISLTASSTNTITGQMIGSSIQGNIILDSGTGGGSTTIYYDAVSYPQGTITLLNGAQFLPLPSAVKYLGQYAFKHNVTLGSDNVFFESGGFQLYVLEHASIALTINAALNTLNGQTIILYIQQDGTGGRTVTFSGVTWLAGTAPQINSAASSITVLRFSYTGGVIFGEQVTSSLPSVSVAASTKTLAAADSNTMQLCTVTTAITVPDNTIIPGTVINFQAQVSGSSQVTFAAGSGMTINSDSGLLAIANQWDVVSLYFNSYTSCTLAGVGTSQLVGSTAGTTPATGLVGETLQASVASGTPVSLTTATNTVITNVNYSAGNWLVTANPTFIGTTLTGTIFQTSCSTASGTSTTGTTTYNTDYATPPVATTSSNFGAPLCWTFSTNSSGTMYLKANATFSVGTCTAFGGLTMVRLP